MSQQMPQQQQMTPEQIRQALQTNVMQAKVDHALTEFDENIEKARSDLQSAIYAKQRYIMQVTKSKLEGVTRTLENYEARLAEQAAQIAGNQASVAATTPAAPVSIAPAAPSQVVPVVGDAENKKA